jgi:tRNA-Thr(GGU) m(6)t(6)A37 methyltransferase TsaA
MRTKLTSIGVIRASSTNKEGASDEKDTSAISEIEVLRKYQEGLKDIEGFSHLIILYLFHKTKSHSLHVRPPLDTTSLRGVFATRSPNRPNRIGLSVVELVERNGNKLKVKGLDAEDNTPLLDIKPYTPKDRIENVKIGWLEGKI